MNHILYLILQYSPSVALALLQISGLDPIIQILKTKETNDVNYVPFIAMIMNFTVWTYYGYLITDWVVFGSNLGGFICGCWYLTVYCCYAEALIFRRIRNYLIALSLGLIAIVTSVSLIEHGKYAPDIIGFLGCGCSILLMASPLSTMKKVMDEKNTSTMSLFMSISITLNCALWTSYAIFIENMNPFILVPNLTETFAGLIQLVLFCIYPSSEEPSSLYLTGYHPIE